MKSLLVLLCLSSSVYADKLPTVFRSVGGTNYNIALIPIRESQGIRLMNAGISPETLMPDWKWIDNTTIVEIIPGGIIARTDKTIVSRLNRVLNPGTHHQQTIWGGGGETSRQVIQGEPFLVLHYPTTNRRDEGHTASFAAMRTGSTNRLGQRMQLYDYGLAPVQK